MRTGKLIAFNGPGKSLEIRTELVRKLLPGEILVKNQFTTICGSDLHTYTGLRKEPCPVVLGHEIVGTIVEIERQHSGRDYNSEKLEPGDLITWTIFSSDPTSSLSRDGMPQKGDNLFKYGHAQITEREHFHGGLAEYCILRPGTGILKLPKDLPPQVAATVNCSISTVAGAIRLAGNLRDKKVVIFGAGMLGITCAAMCRVKSAKWVSVVDMDTDRLTKAMSFGADQTFNLNVCNLVEEIATKFPTNGVDVVFDMSGSPEAMESGMELLGIGGKAIWVGAVFGTRKVQVNPENLIRKLITIRGLHNYNFEDFVSGLNFIKRNWKRFPFESAVEKEFDLEDAEKAFDYALRNKPLRVGIRIK
ncbi:zinc-binding dehydrogenase [Lunatibacter salilacus]|uniref:zinc-binding dehydrogenase n=1 Tax=Lunatibacter salilacus TaxID=2483804 RepID=UPI00131B5887|nr:zinc-binding dehydrogenase [Lunatibacter salilacus]